MPAYMFPWWQLHFPSQGEVQAVWLRLKACGRRPTSSSRMALKYSAHRRAVRSITQEQQWQRINCFTCRPFPTIWPSLLYYREMAKSFPTFFHECNTVKDKCKTVADEKIQWSLHVNFVKTFAMCVCVCTWAWTVLLNVYHMKVQMYPCILVST